MEVLMVRGRPRNQRYGGWQDRLEVDAGFGRGAAALGAQPETSGSVVISNSASAPLLSAAGVPDGGARRAAAGPAVLERKPNAIVADTFLAWGIGVGFARGIPVCSLWTQPATFFLALWHLDRWPPVDGQAVRLATIPNVIPSERVRGTDFAGFFEAVHIKMVAPVERLLDWLSLEQKPDAIVADTFLAWGIGVGSARGIPVCSLWTQPATFFLALWHLDRWPTVDGQDVDQVHHALGEAPWRLGQASAGVACSSLFIMDTEATPMDSRRSSTGNQWRR
ncbi:hypothetical protein ZEAMMB73_Zm00001d018083 [Zea mays]|uniref:Uncharacterized protein n=1 Tax=Zea mays TaxID=4577 RepID=A0A1D6HKN7_MAIZE|nr:hypothetical protein ZEAMMB73_Zm00001d018083 [Zea mays]